ncbi:MAG: transcriptional regulator [Gammaproteobacteria bacterium]|nr:transcriptional regulator [Gammaproteobacteria bacterium]
MKNRLKELRSEKKLSQENLASLVNVSRQTIISIEKGKYSPSLPLAFQLAEVLQVQIEDIFIPE